MDEQSFTVTLPSNSNMATHPANRGSNYIVRLCAPLNFTGQTLNEDANWEVALASLQYTNQFYEVREPHDLHVVVKFPNISAIDVSKVPTLRGVAQYDADISMARLTSAPTYLRHILSRYVKNDNTEPNSFICYTKLVIPAGHYKDPSDMYRRIVDDFNKLFDTERYKTHMDVVVKGADGKIELKLEPDTNKLHLYATKPDVGEMLGLPATTVKHSFAGTPPVVSTMLLYACIGTRTPRFEAIQSLYVYSDIIKPQHVGDTLVKLLEVVPVQGTPGVRVHYPVNPLTYLPVIRTLIEDIAIEICDESGNYVTFPDDVENVICRMRFRRSKRNALTF